MSFLIPKDRIAVIIGTDGNVRKRIEELTGTSIEIDSATGAVIIKRTEDSESTIGDWIAQNIIKAIARGFNPKIAERLADDEYIFEIIDLEGALGHNKKTIHRVKSRLIGENGKTWKTIETLSEASLSIYGNTVAIIAKYEELKIAREAITRLVGGQNHSSVYKYLQKQHEELKRRQLAEMWKPSTEF
nr:KH domain-containing protein [Candidatus Sigynarchaeota archaeon]